MTVEGLRIEEAGQVLTLTIDRVEQQNSLTYDIRNAIVDELERASADLRSRPPMPPSPQGAPERAVGGAARMIRTGWGRLIAAVMDCEKPVVAAVNGTAAGGGMHLALACDLVLMADTARFIEVFIRRGIIPDAGGAFILPRIIGIQKTKELMFFGDDLSAAEAERIGLVNKVVPAAELQKVAGEWVSRLATMPTQAIGLTKALVNRSLSVDRTTSFEEEAWFQEINNVTEDAKEGMMSFVERRPSEFKGW